MNRLRLFSPIIGGAKCIVVHPTKILGGPWPTRQRSQWGLRSAVSSPTGVAFCCVVCLQVASGCSIFGSLVSIAMSGNCNESQSRLRSNLVSASNLRHINIIVIQTGKLIFVGSKIAASLNFAALFGRTPRTCLRPALTIFE